MFVFSKGRVKTFNPLTELKSEREVSKILKGKNYNITSKSYRNKDGSLKKSADDDKMLERLSKSSTKIYKTRSNVWSISAGYMLSTRDIIAYKHPAIFPEKLAEDHILSWSNEGDLVLDPFSGSGTTAKMAKLNKRDFIGFEISQEYVDIANKRLNE